MSSLSPEAMRQILVAVRLAPSLLDDFTIVRELGRGGVLGEEAHFCQKGLEAVPGFEPAAEGAQRKGEALTGDDEAGHEK